MPTKVVRVNRADIEKEMRRRVSDKLLAVGDKIADELEVVIVAEHNKILADWVAAYTPLSDPRNSASFASVARQRNALYKIATPKIVKREISITSQLSLVIKLGVAVVDDQGKINNLWYWLDRGTQPFTQKRASPFLGSNANSGREYNQMRVGDVRPGLIAREWSEKVIPRSVKATIKLKNWWSQEWQLKSSTEVVELESR